MSFFYIFYFSSDSAWVDPADVRRQEHDGGLRPPPRQIPDRCRRLPRPDVHEGGGRTDEQHPEQEQRTLRRVDPEQRDHGRLRYPAQRTQDGRHLHR